MKQHTNKIFLGDLMGCKIVTAEGKVLGHIHDVEISAGPEYQVTALLYGRGGLENHLHMLNPFRGEQQPPARPKSIPWRKIASIEQHTVRLRASKDD
ncbi:PRC-barrel domain-containing protein [Dictyobacter arantiisoli]|uniref:PRC-barrel domain-containing protein n=1 Tax=Dictyobacter arantiisoli TaxID=2014874 RepID=A0A5A5TG25_9CHLR|nr:PRC-barrel domain-containing protein [Dictyobacter arantiisoli]GCF10302.1 hypothetical protein KDI_38660 [Dictyobacter arantiisoli]